MTFDEDIRTAVLRLITFELSGRVGDEEDHEQVALDITNELFEDFYIGAYYQKSTLPAE